MKTSGNTILITGGATGIGFGLAEAFINAGNRVLICGRRQAKLEEARVKLPDLQIFQCDVTSKDGRESLYNWVKNQHPGLNILVNNAGVSGLIDFKKGVPEAFKSEDEIETNLKAPVLLSGYFIPLLLAKPDAAIINISSGLAFIPLVSSPLYGATKAGLHSFSLALRFQLKDTNIKVFELMPPICDTDLGKDDSDDAPRPSYLKGIPPSEFAKDALTAIANDQYEFASGEAKQLKDGSQRNFEETFQSTNNR
ncbi:MAG: SDR family NAD(P)-dependent oxidoreductase [Candidatus Omnitrophica bacterium]|nr:SDR family NAD(P)-dependent oxidoreductase [Candidatus Omnitrophota bacterium]